MKLIIDKSFLQAESRGCRRLHFLAEAGWQFVLTDTLVYELCSGSRSNEWEAAQKKMFPFAEIVESWRHVGELLEEEIKNQCPVVSVIDQECTDRLRKWFKSGAHHVPANLSSLVEKSREEREVDSVGALLKWCRTFAEFEDVKKYQIEVQKRISMGIDVRPSVGGFVSNEKLIRWSVAISQGRDTNSDIFIAGAENGLSKDWLSYRSAQTRLALLGVWIMKGWDFETANKEFRNTKLDMDYVDLLSFGEGIVTNETSGALADMLGWVHGDTKLVFSSRRIDEMIPSQEDIRTKAYSEWLSDCKPLGDDQAHWYRAERILGAEAWNSILPMSVRKVTLGN